MSSSPPSRTLYFWWIAGLVFAAILRIGLIEAHGLWNNEFITLRVLDKGYLELIEERLGVNHMPLYFVMEKAWTDAFGTSEASLRAIGAIFGWLAVWAMGRLARRIGGLRLAVPVVFAAAIHQMWLTLSLDARMYAVLIWAAAEGTDAWFAWARAEAAGDRTAARRSLVRWTLVSVFTIHIHMLYATIFAFHVLDAVLRRWKEKLSLRGPAIAMGVGAVLCIPITIAWVLNQNKFGEDRALNFKGAGVLHRQTLRFFVGDYNAIERYVGDELAYDFIKGVGYLLFLVSLVGLVRLFRRSNAETAESFFKDAAARRDLLAVAWSYPLFLVGLYVAQLFSHSQIIGTERYYATFFPAVLLFSAAGLMYWFLRNRRRGLLFGGATFLLQALFVTAYYTGPGEGFREGIQMMEADLPEGRGVVAVMSGGGETGLNTYYGKTIDCYILDIDRYEEKPSVIREKLEWYTAHHPEFWVMVYHEKERTLWKVLENPKLGYEPLTDRHEMGKSIVQLYRRTRPVETRPEPLPDEEASDESD